MGGTHFCRKCGLLNFLQDGRGTLDKFGEGFGGRLEILYVELGTDSRSDAHSKVPKPKEWFKLFPCLYEEAVCSREEVHGECETAKFVEHAERRGRAWWETYRLTERSIEGIEDALWAVGGKGSKGSRGRSEELTACCTLHERVPWVCSTLRDEGIATTHKTMGTHGFLDALTDVTHRVADGVAVGDIVLRLTDRCGFLAVFLFIFFFIIPGYPRAYELFSFFLKIRGW